VPPPDDEAPDDTVTAPLVPVTVVPELKIMLPLAVPLTASALTMDTAPEEVRVPAPLLMETEPPASLVPELAPAVTMTAPPESKPPPAVKLIAPPLLADPVPPSTFT